MNFVHVIAAVLAAQAGAATEKAADTAAKATQAAGEILRGSGVSPGTLNPIDRAWLREAARSTPATSTDALFMWIFWFSVVCFVVLMGLMTYWVIKYRRKPGQIAQPSPSHNTPLEIAWTVLPLVVLAYIFFEGFHGYMDKLVAPAGAYEIKVQGAKWNWTAQYEKGESSGESTVNGVQTIPIFYAPADHPVKLRFESIDVLHAFWIPDFRVKQDVMPNRYTSYWFNAMEPDGVPRPGIGGGFIEWDNKRVPYSDHWVFCAEYCGTSHSEMAAIIRIVPKEYFFKKWLPDNGIGKLPPWDLGERVFKQRCASCHSIDGSKNTGPTWQGAWGKPVEFADGTSLDLTQPNAWENYAKESILYPAKNIHKGYDNKMNSFAGILDDKALNAVIEFMKSPNQRPEGGGAVPAAEEKK